VWRCAGIWRTWIDGIVETTKGAIRRLFCDRTELILKSLRSITIVKTSKKLLVLTGAEFFHQTDDDGVKSYIHHKAGEKMASPELTDEKLLNLTPEEVKNLSPEQQSRREFLRRTTPLKAAPVAVASPYATPVKK
jgi:hypothetical protein